MSTGTPYPTELKKIPEDRALLIVWSDGEQRRYAFSELREKCPCATCREQRKKPAETAAADGLLPVISTQEAQPLDITGMKPVGNYAYTIAFNDGHDTGIFSFTFLRGLGSAESSS